MKRLARFLPACVWASLIFWLSHQPDLPSPPFVFAGFDKVVHAGFYGILGLLLTLGDGVRRRAWWWVAAAAIYGLSDEMHQAFVPGRSADVMDFVADAAGALLAVALWQKVGILRLERGPS